MNIPATPAGETQQKSLGELFVDLTRETTTLVRQEISLAQAEMTRKATKAGRDIGMVMAGGALAYAGLIVLLIGIALGLVAAGMASWLAYLLVGAVVAGIGAFLAFRGLNALKTVDPVPHETIDTLKADTQWAKEQLKP
ncbi:MAG: phage holin family protein [Capsulimonadales bacterium]|nr:phage holin family protein [Capsulimonadales bacterium]